MCQRILVTLIVVAVQSCMEKMWNLVISFPEIWLLEWYIFNFDGKFVTKIDIVVIFLQTFLKICKIFKFLTTFFYHNSREFFAFFPSLACCNCFELGSLNVGCHEYIAVQYCIESQFCGQLDKNRLASNACNNRNWKSKIKNVNIYLKLKTLSDQIFIFRFVSK